MKTIDCKNTDRNGIIKQAVAVLAAGGLLIYPTETTYGLGVDATNQEAVDKLLRYKTRREGKPLSVAVADELMAEKYVNLNKQAKNLYRNFLPGPVTIISNIKKPLADGVASERQTLGVRIPDYPLVSEIIAAFGRPITSTSANASYKKRPYNVSDIFNNISQRQKDLIDLVLDAGQLPKRQPSTIVDTTLDYQPVLRQGQVKLTEATQVISYSTDETRLLGAKLARQFQQDTKNKALIFAMIGPMGAGKTQLVKGIAEALSITQPVASPTYNIAREYKLADQKPPFIHIDTWRLFSEADFLALGIDGMVDSSSIIAIEWADKVIGSLEKYSDKAKIIWIKLSPGENENQRKISYSDRRH